MNKIKLFTLVFLYIFSTISSGYTLFTQQVLVNRNSGMQSVSKLVNGNTFAVYPAAGNYILNKNDISVLDNITVFNWQLKFSAAGKVFKDISFYNQNTGYIVTELGAVYKTTNGGNNWEIKMNLGFPYYWYGVHALSQDTVVISGFNNQGNIHSGVIRWTFNGGNTWSSDISISIPAGVGWLSKVHFFDQNKGIVMAEFSGAVFYTLTGGKDSASWNYVQVNSDLAWFAGNIDAQPNGNCYATGIHFAKSTNFGLNWVSGPSADGTFDGGVDFLDNNNLKGWTGGGQISPSSAGWCHRTTDGGSSWSDRLLNFPFPIRAVKFFNDTLGFAVGGNLYQETGGIYSSTNGGLNWSLDISTAAEMFSMDYKQVTPDSIDVWCVGSTGGGTGYTGKLYKGRFALPVSVKNIQTSIPEKFLLYQNFPNPFNPTTKIKFSIPSNVKHETSNVKLIIYNVLGNEITILINEQLNPGSFEITWDASNYTSGVYFYQLKAGDYSETKKMLLVK